ncbi:sugar kinase, partial [Mycobacterium sp. ITM-2017-0098]
GLVDAAGVLVHRAQRPTPDGDAETVWETAASLLAEVRAASDGGHRAVGVASAGPVDIPAGTVSPINVAEWRRFPIVDRVADATGLPV